MKLRQSISHPVSSFVPFRPRVQFSRHHISYTIRRFTVKRMIYVPDHLSRKRPERLPVNSPARSATTPLTNTASTPSQKECGDV